MIHFIAHRGNITGKNKYKENTPGYLKEALNLGYEVEVDIWFSKGRWYSGHDEPQFKIDFDLLKDKRVWCHAKNISAFKIMIETGVHCFWHEEDTFTLTNRGYIWSYPGCEQKGCISVLPEKRNLYIKGVSGFCSDYIKQYKEKYMNELKIVDYQPFVSKHNSS